MPGTIKTASMDNNKNLELEILITMRQNKKVPIDRFCNLFEHGWILYHTKFNQLMMEGLFVPVQIADLSVYQLTPAGKARIAQLVEQREREITVRLLHLRHFERKRSGIGKSAMALLNSIVHFRILPQKIAGSETTIINKA